MRTRYDNGLAEPTSSPRVFTVGPLPPEKLAYALARYSRSPDSIRASLEWVRNHDSSKFLESFYFQYGHASIADLGHLAVCFEGVSICLAIRRCPFKNSGFVHGSSGLAGAHSCPLASRMEFNQRKADSMLLPTIKISASVCPVSSEKDVRFAIFAPACPLAFLCLERTRIFHQLPAIRHEDPLD